MKDAVLYLILIFGCGLFASPVILTFKDWLWARINRYLDWRRACRGEDERVEQLRLWRLKRRHCAKWRGVYNEMHWRFHE